MIKPLNTLQLSSAKPRTGLQSIAELLPRLIRQYEMQAQLAGKQSQEITNTVTFSSDQANQPGTPTQVTFSWYK